MIRLLVGLLACTLAGFAAEAARVWKSSELKAYEKKLGPKIDAQKIGSEGFGKIGTSETAQISHREGNGIAELHETKDDIFVVQTGEAWLESGGTVASPKTTEPHEVRGPSINSPKKQKLEAGDVVFIPAGTPHRLLIDAGKQFTYFVIKVGK